MATIKSYSDLEQSKKLAEILPLESADMYYPWYIEEDGDTIESGHRINTPNIGNFITHKINKMILPCWSLAALLNVLSDYQLQTQYDGIEILCLYKGKFYTVSADNPVDACATMIEKLNELNLL